jgi:hypothetical protein
LLLHAGLINGEVALLVLLGNLVGLPFELRNQVLWEVVLDDLKLGL